MSIEVEFSPVLRPYTGNQPTVTADGGTVGECIGRVAAMFPKIKRVLLDRSGQLNRNVNIYINEVDAYPDPLTRPLRDGDKLHIVMLIGGG